MAKQMCKRCGQEFACVQSLETHLKRKKVCTATLDDIPRELILDEILKKRKERFGTIMPYKCDLCPCQYKTPHGLQKHKCTHHVTASDGHILTDILTSIKTLTDKLDNIDEQARNTLHINNVTINGDVSATTNNVVQLNNFGNEDLDYVRNDKDFMWSCARNLSCFGANNGMKQLVSRIHFDPENKSNRNVRLKSLKRDLVEVFDQGRWSIRDKDESVDRMIRTGYRLIDEYYRNSEGIKEYDEKELDSRIFSDLLKMATRDKTIYNYLRKAIFALVVDETQKDKDS